MTRRGPRNARSTSTQHIRRMVSQRRRSWRVEEPTRIAHALRMCDDGCVAKMIQVRDVPDRLHRELVRRAKARRQTLTDYIQQLLEREVAHPPVDELLARIARHRPVKLPMSPAALIRADRRAREERWARPLPGRGLDVPRRSAVASTWLSRRA